jgi:3-hydroxyisobutyrate dehydrogenase
MTKIAFLGQGAMGSRMAARLVAAGHEVTVWNRTPVRPPQGSTLAIDIAAAVAGADMVVAMLRDDVASRAVWDVALPALPPGALAVECSTLSPAHMRTLHAEATARGVRFLDAPVAGSRPQAEAGTLIFMAGGEAEVVTAAEAVLMAMGSAVHHAGGPGAGAVVKLMVNTLFAAQVAAVAEVLGMARASGIDPARGLEVAAATPVVSGAAKAAGMAMLAGNFAPAFPIDLVQKDLAMAVASSDLPLTEAVAARFDAAAKAGLADRNITAVAQLYG